MMLTIHGISKNVKFFQLKSFITEICNISDFILDEYSKDNDGVHHKIRIGVAAEEDGAVLMRCLEGYQLEGSRLSVKPIGKESGLHQGPEVPYFEPAPLDQRQQQQQYGYMQTSQMQPMRNVGPSQVQKRFVNNQEYTEHSTYAPQPAFDKSTSSNNNINKRQEPRAPVLRTVEVLTEPIHGGARPNLRYPNQSTNQAYDPAPIQEKPVVIYKDHFQSSSEAGASFSGMKQHQPPQPWLPENTQSYKTPFSKPMPSAFDQAHKGDSYQGNRKYGADNYDAPTRKYPPQEDPQSRKNPVVMDYEPSGRKLEGNFGQPIRKYPQSTESMSRKYPPRDSFNEANRNFPSQGRDNPDRKVMPEDDFQYPGKSRPPQDGFDNRGRRMPDKFEKSSIQDSSDISNRKYQDRDNFDAIVRKYPQDFDNAGRKVVRKDDYNNSNRNFPPQDNFNASQVKYGHPNTTFSRDDLRKVPPESFDNTSRNVPQDKYDRTYPSENVVNNRERRDFSPPGKYDSYGKKILTSSSYDPHARQNIPEDEYNNTHGKFIPPTKYGDPSQKHLPEDSIDSIRKFPTPQHPSGLQHSSRPMKGSPMTMYSPSRQTVASQPPGAFGNRYSPGRYRPYDRPSGSELPWRPHSPPRRQGSPIRTESSPRRPISPSRRPMTPPRRPISPSRRPMSPSRRPISPARRPMTPPRRPMSPSRRPITPPRRPITPPRRPMSPSRKPMSPSRRPMTPPRRPASPPRILEPPRGRRDSPMKRRESPPQKIGWAPPDQKVSPPLRYPNRPRPKPMDKIGPTEENMSNKPSYQAASEGIYEDAHHFRGQNPPHHSKDQAEVWKRLSPRPAHRIGDAEDRFHPGRYQYEGTAHADIQRMKQNVPGRLSRTQPAPRSRSPVRRARTPPLENYERYSMSSQSPPRSWIREKPRHRSPRDAPPPPNWPQEASTGRSLTSDDIIRKGEEDKMKRYGRTPTWDGRSREPESNQTYRGRDDPHPRPKESQFDQGRAHRDKLDPGVPHSSYVPVREDLRRKNDEWNVRDDGKYSHPRAENNFDGSRRDVRQFRHDQERHVELIPPEDRSSDFAREEYKFSDQDILLSERKIKNVNEWETKLVQTRQSASKELARLWFYRNLSVDVSETMDKAMFRLFLEVKKTILRLIDGMLGEKFVPYREILVKYRRKYNNNSENRILKQVMARISIDGKIIADKRAVKTTKQSTGDLKTSAPGAVIKKKPTVVAKKANLAKVPLTQPDKKPVVTTMKPTGTTRKPIATTRRKPTETTTRKPTVTIRRKPVETKKKAVESKSKPTPEKRKHNVEETTGGSSELNPPLKKVVKTSETKSPKADKKLYIKVLFSRTPSPMIINGFRKKYHVQGMRVASNKSTKIFVGYFHSARDFDRLCTLKKFLHRGITVLVSPLYKLTSDNKQPKTKSSNNNVQKSSKLTNNSTEDKPKATNKESNENKAKGSANKTNEETPKEQGKPRVKSTPVTEPSGDVKKPDTNEEETKDIKTNEKPTPALESAAKTDKKIDDKKQESKTKVKTPDDVKTAKPIANKNVENVKSVETIPSDDGKDLHDDNMELDLSSIMGDAIILDECSGSDEE